MHEKRVAGAPLAMRARGKETDLLVLGEIGKKPGSTVRELADVLGWTNGRVDHSVNRLLSKNKVMVKHQLRRGVLVKKVFSADEPVTPSDLVEVPRKLIDDSLWEDRAHIYGLSRSTIGISPRPVEEWDKRSSLKEECPLQKGEESIAVRFPSSISDFYQIENSETSLSIVGNLVMLTVETILPVALPPTYPEEVVARTRSVEFERVRVKIKDTYSYARPLSVPIDREEREGEGTTKEIVTSGMSPQAFESEVPLVTGSSSGVSQASIHKIRMEVK